jgi:hypothetical protein
VVRNGVRSTENVGGRVGSRTKPNGGQPGKTFTGTAPTARNSRCRECSRHGFHPWTVQLVADIGGLMYPVYPVPGSTSAPTAVTSLESSIPLEAQ